MAGGAPHLTRGEEVEGRGMRFGVEVGGFYD